MRKKAGRFTVCEATSANAGRLAVFGARLFRETFGPFSRPDDIDRYVAEAFAPETLRANLAESRVTTFLCLDAGAWAGFVELWPGAVPGQPGTDGAVEIRRFYVDRPWHGSGAAQTLLAAVAGHASARGCATLWLGVWERNARAIGFYRKAGFRKTGTHEFMLGDDRQVDDVMTCAVDDLRAG